jgi:hypothetical protein
MWGKLNSPREIIIVYWYLFSNHCTRECIHTGATRERARGCGVCELTQRKCLPLFLLGGARTGSQLHQDGHATVSWNVCCFGTTRWVFLAPDTDIAALRLDECLEGAVMMLFCLSTRSPLPLY